MKKSDIRDIVQKGMVRRCLIKFRRKRFDSFSFQLLPLSMSKKLLLGLKDDGYQFDGYRVVRVKDIAKAGRSDNLYNEILWKEGQLSRVELPPVPVDCWQAAFTALERSGKVVSIEREGRSGRTEFAVGIVERARGKKLKLRCFDEDGAWHKELLVIPYKTIASLTFGGRREEVLSKYLPL